MWNRIVSVAETKSIHTVMSISFVTALSALIVFSKKSLHSLLNMNYTFQSLQKNENNYIPCPRKFSLGVLCWKISVGQVVGVDVKYCEITFLR